MPLNIPKGNLHFKTKYIHIFSSSLPTSRITRQHKSIADIMLIQIHHTAMIVGEKDFAHNKYKQNTKHILSILLHFYVFAFPLFPA